MKNFTVSLSNIYGLPFYNATVERYAKAVNAELVFGVTHLPEYKRNPHHEFTLVLASLPILVSSNVPYLGYHFVNGMYQREHSLPKVLKPNTAKLVIPKYSMPPSEVLHKFYASGGDPEVVAEYKRFNLRLNTDVFARVFVQKPSKWRESYNYVTQNPGSDD